MNWLHRTAANCGPFTGAGLVRAHNPDPGSASWQPQQRSRQEFIFEPPQGLQLCPLDCKWVHTWIDSAHMAALVCTVCICLAMCAYAVATRLRRGLLDLLRMPGPPGRWAAGNLYEILRPDFHRVMARWAARYGEVFKVQVLGLHGVVVACPSTIQRLFGRGEGDIPKHVGSYWHLDILWSEGRTHSIFTDLATDTWRAVRRAVAPCFSASAVRCTRNEGLGPMSGAPLAVPERLRALRAPQSGLCGHSILPALQAELSAREAQSGGAGRVASAAGPSSSRGHG